MTEAKVAVSGTASQKSDAENSAKKSSSAKTKKKFQNPFSYSDPLQSKVVNCIMRRGKKTVAQKILQQVFQELSNRGQKDPLKTFENALAKVTPSMEVKPKRVGGSIYQIPMEVKPKRQQTLSIRWVLEGARKRKGMPMFKRLALELIDAANETGYAFNKKEDAHRMAQSNKAFAHFARY